MSVEGIQELRAAAEQAFSAGQFQQALAHSIRLERAEPDVPAWARYTARICLAMGRTLDQIDALDRAASRHVALGELLKAATVCKHILSLNPDHEGARRTLADLRISRGEPPRPVRSPPPRMTTNSFRHDEGTGLHALPLRDVVPGARRVRKPDGTRAGVFAIPLEDDPEGSLSVQLSEASSELPTGMAAPQVVRRSPSASPSLPAEDAAVLAVAEELRAAQRTEQALTDTPLFRDMPQEAFYELIDRAKIVTFKRDQDVFRQGSPAAALYVIAEGEVGVIDEGPPRRGISKLGEGDFFGEMALVSDAPRSATCAALTDVELISIDRETVQGVLRSYPEVLTVMLRFFRDRSIVRVLQTSPLFSSLSPRDRELIRPYFRFLEVESKAVLIPQGARAEGLFVLLAGKAEVVVHHEGTVERLGILVPGDVAGEMSLLEGTDATATVRAIDKLFVLEFPAVAFQKLLRAHPSVREFVQRVVRARKPGS